MEKWILENMKDCMVYGYSFEWFFNNRKDDYLSLHTKEEYAKEWKKLYNKLAGDF